LKEWLEGNGFQYRLDFDDYVLYRNMEDFVVLTAEVVNDAEQDAVMREYIVQRVSEALAT
jgi:hypothetical protein